MPDSRDALSESLEAAFESVFEAGCLAGAKTAVEAALPKMAAVLAERDQLRLKLEHKDERIAHLELDIAGLQIDLIGARERIDDLEEKLAVPEHVTEVR